MAIFACEALKEADIAPNGLIEDMSWLAVKPQLLFLQFAYALSHSSYRCDDTSESASSAAEDQQKCASSFLGCS